MTPELRAYYWIGQALDKYANEPLSPECERVRLIYHKLRLKARRALRLALNRSHAQPRQVLPDLRSVHAAPERTSIHAAPCGTGGSWSAHHSKGPGREPDLKGYSAAFPGSPRVGVQREAVRPSSLAYSSSSPPPETSPEAQAAFDEFQLLLSSFHETPAPAPKKRWMPLR